MASEYYNIYGFINDKSNIIKVVNVLNNLLPTIKDTLV